MTLEPSQKQKAQQGTYYNTDPKMSAQPCGCDPGAQYRCERHGAVIGPADNVWRIDPTLTRRTAQMVIERHDAKIEGIHDSGQRMKFASGSMRDPSTGKLDWTRVTFGPMLRRWAKHLTTAEAKYPDPAPGVPNFSLIESKEELIRYKKSAMRHFMSWYYDESDEDHASAVYFNINGVEIIKAKQRGDLVDGITYTPKVPPTFELSECLGSVLRNEADYAGR